MPNLDFILDLAWPWSMTPAQGLQHLAGGCLPTFACRFVVAALVGLAVGLAPRRGTPLAGLPVFIMMAVGWLLAGFSMPVLAFVLVIYLTIATYRGGSSLGRSLPKLLIVLALRLIALVLTMVTIARPTLLVRSETKVPSVLIILADRSASMSIRDEFNNQTRFEAMRATLDRCKSIMEQLQKDQQITVMM